MTASDIYPKSHSERVPEIPQLTVSKVTNDILLPLHGNQSLKTSHISKRRQAALNESASILGQRVHFVPCSKSSPTSLLHSGSSSSSFKITTTNLHDTPTQSCLSAYRKSAVSISASFMAFLVLTHLIFHEITLLQ